MGGRKEKGCILEWKKTRDAFLQWRKRLTVLRFCVEGKRGVKLGYSDVKEGHNRKNNDRGLRL